MVEGQSLDGSFKLGNLFRDEEMVDGSTVEPAVDKAKRELIDEKKDGKLNFRVIFKSEKQISKLGKDFKGQFRKFLADLVGGKLVAGVFTCGPKEICVKTSEAAFEKSMKNVTSFGEIGFVVLKGNEFRRMQAEAKKRKRAESVSESKSCQKFCKIDNELEAELRRQIKEKDEELGKLRKCKQKDSVHIKILSHKVKAETGKKEVIYSPLEKELLED